MPVYVDTGFNYRFRDACHRRQIFEDYNYYLYEYSVTSRGGFCA
jgi:hypothetical protein